VEQCVKKRARDLNTEGMPVMTAWMNHLSSSKGRAAEISSERRLHWRHCGSCGCFIGGFVEAAVVLHCVQSCFIGGIVELLWLLGFVEAAVVRSLCAELGRVEALWKLLWLLHCVQS